MRKCLAILVLLFTTFLSAKTITVVTEAWAPYVFEDNGAYAGFDYEVMKTVLEEMGHKVDFKFYPWKRCIQMIETQKVDAILDCSRTDERDKTMYFPAENLSSSHSVLFFKRGMNYKFESLEDLKGLTIGTTRGYHYSDAFDETDLFKKEPVDKNEVNFKKLLKDRINLFIVNKNAGLFLAKKMGVLDQVDFIKKPVSGGKLYLAFSKKIENKKLSKAFGEALKKFKKTQKYKEILAKYGQ